MSVYKEEHYELLALQRRQSLVFNDSADIGIKVGTFSDPSVQKIREIIFDRLSGLKVSRSEGRDFSYIDVCLTVHIPWEQEGAYCTCNTWEIHYFDIKGTKYVTLDTRCENVHESDVF